MTGVWLGRVFGAAEGAGSLTAVLSDPRGDPAPAARRLGFPDTAFVQHHEGRSAEIRTFSPVEEVGLCIRQCRLLLRTGPEPAVGGLVQPLVTGTLGLYSPR